jgi:hypothetical protein
MQRQGFYFAVTDGIRWKDAAEAISKIGKEQKWLPADSKVVSYDRATVGGFSQDPARALYLWGSNSRANSVRAKQLGWKPHGPDFWTVLPEDIKRAVAEATTK